MQMVPPVGRGSTTRPSEMETPSSMKAVTKLDTRTQEGPVASPLDTSRVGSIVYREAVFARVLVSYASRGCGAGYVPSDRSASCSP
jgi:hypothetical protein